MEPFKHLFRTFINQLPKDALILDLGCGEGDYALSLAQQGFTVEAVDKEKNPLEALLQRAEDVSLTTKESDILSFPFTKSYGAILSLNVLHCLTREERKVLLRNMKESTQSRGFHLLTAFTTEGDLRSDKLHFFNHGELRAHYDDWNVLAYAEAMRPTRERYEEGDQKYHEIAFLAAQKP